MNQKLSAIIPAAGFSSRMGTFKPLLPLGHQTVLEKTIQSMLQAGIRDIRVVVGYRAELVVPVLDQLGVKAIVNDKYREGMFSSVQAGVKTLGRNTDGFFLLPADYPIIKPKTINTLAEQYDMSCHGILYPRFGSRRGHPPLIAARYIDNILTWNGPEGMRGFLRGLEQDAMDIEVDDQGVCLDMDTPADYAKLAEAVVGDRGLNR